MTQTTTTTANGNANAPVFATPSNLPVDDHAIAATKKRLTDAGVRYCYASYVDIHGIPKAKCTPIDAFDKMARGSELFTVGAMEGMGLVGPQEDECAAVPDLDTQIIFPWDKTQAWFAGQLYYHEKPYPNDSRVILKRTLDHAASLGYVLNLGLEPEFYVFKLDPDTAKPAGFQPHKFKGTCPAYDVHSTATSMHFLDPMVRYMNELDWGVFSFDQEGGHSQFEFDFQYTDALTMADRFIFLRLMAKHVAQQLGYIATFMPKPFPNDFRSGAHFNMSLADPDTGDNLFKPEPDGNHFIEKHDMPFSKIAYHFAAGLLQHAPALTALTCPTYNSYQGLIAQGDMLDISWAPVLTAYGRNNRSAMLRMPMSRYCLENRAPDMTTNPYLSAAFTLAAGLDGIERQLDPGTPLNDNCYNLTLDDLKKQGVKMLPRTLLHALEAFDADPLVDEVFGEFKDIYLKQKHAEFNHAFYQVPDQMLEQRLTFY